MANEKELPELYSRPGAESFRVLEDENGKVRATMGRGEIITATLWVRALKSRTAYLLVRC